MPKTLIDVTGLDELIARMKRYPVEMAKGMELTMKATLLTLWENVPPYPAPPPDSAYDRTGTLGRSLGSDIGGGQGVGEPSVFVVRKLGAGFEGKFGTNLEYAPLVIGDDTQAEVHRGRWYTMRTIASRASEKINRLWQTLGEQMARFLEGQGK